MCASQMNLDQLELPTHHDEGNGGAEMSVVKQPAATKKRPAAATFASRAPKTSKQAKGSQREISTFFITHSDPS